MIDLAKWREAERFRIFHRGGGQTVVQREYLSSMTFYQTRMRYTLTNARPQPVTIDVYQLGLDRSNWSDTRIVEESQVSERLSADQVVWHVPVPANGSVDLEVVFQTPY